jgi:hypothetical protein
MKNTSINDLKFVIEYQTRQVPVKLKPHQQILDIKDLAARAFFLLREEIKLTFENRDISQYDVARVGEFFKGKKNIFIKVMLVTPKQRKLPMSKQLNSTKAKCPCSLCKEASSVVFCRKCAVFLCDTCSKSQAHFMHRDAVYEHKTKETSAKNYAWMLLNEINAYKTNVKEHNSEISNNDVEEKYNNIKQKYDTVLDLYSNMMNHVDVDINANVGNDDSIKNVNKIKEELDTVVYGLYKEYSKGKKKMNGEQFEKMYNDIYTKENTVKNAFTVVNAETVKNELSKGKKRVDDEITKIINEQLINDIPLGLNIDTYRLYNQIITDKNINTISNVDFNVDTSFKEQNYLDNDEALFEY